MPPSLPKEKTHGEPGLRQELCPGFRWELCPGFGQELGLSRGQESTCSVGDRASIPESGRSPGEGNGNALQYSCLENSMDRGAWWVAVNRGCKKSDMTERLSLSLSLSHTIFKADAEKTLLPLKVKVAQLCPALCDPMDCSSWNSRGQNTEVGSLALFQGIFPT